MNYLAMFLGLLPSAIKAAEAIKGLLSGADRKQHVQDALTSLAGGIAVVVPEHAEHAQVAAEAANAAIDGVVGELNAAGVLSGGKYKTTNAVTGIAASVATVAASVAQVAASIQTTTPSVVPSSPAHETPQPVVPPGLHNAVPA